MSEYPTGLGFDDAVAILREVGAAHQVGSGEAGEAAEPCHRQCPLLAVAGPQPFDPLQHIQVAAADLPRDRLQHLAAAQGLRRRRLADDAPVRNLRGPD